eukprot:6477094-Amphidinium_carterae.1
MLKNTSTSLGRGRSSWQLFQNSKGPSVDDIRVPADRAVLHGGSLNLHVDSLVLLEKSNGGVATPSAAPNLVLNNTRTYGNQNYVCFDYMLVPKQGSIVL